jgi:hypothetical protein
MYERSPEQGGEQKDSSENANEVEEKLRQAFSERFPDLAYPAN